MADEWTAEEMDDDTPHECARYAYNKAGERVAYVSARVFNDAQTLGRSGRSHMNLAQPPLDAVTYEGDAPVALAQIMTVDLFVWKHRNYADKYAIKFLSDDDLVTYLSWYPKLSLKADGE